MNSYADRVNLIVDDFINNKLKPEYFYNETHENKLEYIPDKLENIRKAFKAAFGNNSEGWRFSFDELKRNHPVKKGGPAYCQIICNLGVGNEPFNINISVYNKPKGFSLTIAFCGEKETDVNPERDFFFKELNDSLEPLGNYLKSVLIQAKERDKKQ